MLISMKIIQSLKAPNSCYSLFFNNFENYSFIKIAYILNKAPYALSTVVNYITNLIKYYLQMDSNRPQNATQKVKEENSSGLTSSNVMSLHCIKDFAGTAMLLASLLAHYISFSQRLTIVVILEARHLSLQLSIYLQFHKIYYFTKLIVKNKQLGVKEFIVLQFIIFFYIFNLYYSFSFYKSYILYILHFIQTQTNNILSLNMNKSSASKDNNN